LAAATVIAFAEAGLRRAIGENQIVVNSIESVQARNAWRVQYELPTYGKNYTEINALVTHLSTVVANLSDETSLSFKRFTTAGQRAQPAFRLTSVQTLLAPTLVLKTIPPTPGPPGGLIPPSRLSFPSTHAPDDEPFSDGSDSGRTSAWVRLMTIVICMCQLVVVP
jgi:hypothetical protein